MAQVPSKRYDLFIQFFEKRVSEVQQKIDELRKFEPLYNAVRNALEKANIDNDVKIKERLPYLNVTIVANEENHYKDFEYIVIDTCKELLRMKLRDTEPNYKISKISVWEWGWTLNTNIGLILQINVTFPFKGNKYLKISYKKEMVEETIWESTWLEKE